MGLSSAWRREIAVALVILVGAASAPADAASGVAASVPRANSQASVALPLSVPTVPRSFAQPPAQIDVVKAPAPLDLVACDPDGLIDCDLQRAVARISAPGTGVALTWSSEWAAGRVDRPDWSAAALGLAGWSLDILDRYDVANHVLLEGSGDWRVVESVALPDGGFAVPSRDGRRAAVFDRSGVEVEIVDLRLGLPLVRFEYDSERRLSAAHGVMDGRLIGLDVERDANGLPTGLLATGGARTKLQTTASGILVWTVDPAGGFTYLEWNQAGLMTRLTDAAGGSSAFGWDGDGRLVSRTDPDGVALTYARTGTETTVEVTRATRGGHVTVFRHQRQTGSFNRTVVASDGSTTTLVTDSSGIRTLTRDRTRIVVGQQADGTWGESAPLLTPTVTTWPTGANGP